MDICIMSQEKLNRLLSSEEKVVKKPQNFPALPVNTMTQLHALEQFLADDNNLSAISLYLARYIDSTSIENSVRKLLTKIITNNLAQKFSFQGRKSKLKFESL
ncbi:hypothetical protein PUN28_010882 [Cardiocondyla obscurior]|uniref:DUF4806 domain-containing protein n=2 Tax=Cardiocondyla obscurior TaxID=286306 RepID=A0AAW2FKQ7_9HYME